MERIPILALACLLPAQAARADDFCAVLRGAWSASRRHDAAAVSAGIGPGWSCISPDPDGLICSAAESDPATARDRSASLTAEVASCVSALGLKRDDAASSKGRTLFSGPPDQPSIGVALVGRTVAVMVVSAD